MIADRTFHTLRNESGNQESEMTMTALCGIMLLLVLQASALSTTQLVSTTRLRAAAARCRDVVSQVAVSPFEEVAEQGARIVGPLPLTEDNVEAVLDEMRPYLINDGGNVALREIDGATVVLELQGAVADLKDRTPDSREMHIEPPTAVSVILLLTPSGPTSGQCGSCPSSSMTMKMGLERGLLEKIPEIIDVVQVTPDGEAMSEDLINEVLDEIRPFLKMTGGDVALLSVDANDLQPSCTLRLTGSGAALRSIKGEIIQRLRSRMPSLDGVLWEE